MNLSDFYNEFNLAYNNLSSNQAAGLTPYEISVYLTKGQNLLVDNIYEKFETSEEARRNLSVLITTKQLGKINTLSTSDFIYPNYTVAFNQPENLRYIVNEKLKMSDKASRCIRDKYIDITPVSHDEIDRLIKNPFRFNNGRAFRLDAAKDGTSHIEVITKDTNVEYYQIRYIKNPKPIVVENISPDKVEGISAATSCELPESLHRQIVEIAAKLAYQDYKV